MSQLANGDITIALKDTTVTASLSSYRHSAFTMPKPGATKRSTRSESIVEKAENPKLTRHSRTVLNDVSNDVSNGRQTRSLAAKSKSAPSKTNGVDASRRSNQRNSKRLSDQEPSQEESDGVTEKVAAKSRGRKPAAAKKETAKTTRASRSLSRNKAKADASAAKAPSPAKAAAKKTRGRSKTSRKDAKAEVDEPKPTRAAKRSRTRQEGGKQQPTRKAARASSKSKPKKASRSRSRSLSRTISRFKGMAKREVPKHIQPVDDILLEANHNLVRTPFDPCTYTGGLTVYDAPSRDDVLAAPDYVADIFQRLYNAESQSQLVPYMHNQPNLSSTMRAILIDWLVEVHMKFHLVPETLYLGVNILDRYLSIVEVGRNQLQLLGVTALFVASKYEEIYPPEVRDCVYITDRGYTRQQVLDMETNILNTLEFNMSVPTAHPFMQRFLFITKATETMTHASNFYLERVLQEEEFLVFRPSLVAAAAVCLAINHPELREADMLPEDERPGVPDTLLEYTQYSPEEIIHVAALIASKVSEEVISTSNRDLTSVRSKYDASLYKFVSSNFAVPLASDIVGDD